LFLIENFEFWMPVQSYIKIEITPTFFQKNSRFAPDFKPLANRAIYSDKRRRYFDLLMFKTEYNQVSPINYLRA